MERTDEHLGPIEQHWVLWVTFLGGRILRTIAAGPVYRKERTTARLLVHPDLIWSLPSMSISEATGRPGLCVYSGVGGEESKVKLGHNKPVFQPRPPWFLALGTGPVVNRRVS
jgi:hypothetical protein